MAMAGKELLHALAEGELDIHHAAVANRGRNNRCNRGTYVAWSSGSSWAKTATTRKERKAEHPKGKKDQERRRKKIQFQTQTGAVTAFSFRR
jgi:hypothetical protein